MPPPMQSVARPFLALRFCISYSSVISTRAPDAPIGWPMAIAPPLTLTLPVSQPRSLLTAQACAAKASLASIRSRSSTFQPAFLQRRARGRDRAGAHDRRIDAGVRPRDDARERRLAALGGLARRHQHHRGGAVIDAGGVGGGHRAVLVEGRAQLGDRVERGAGLRIFVGVDDDVALAALDRDRRRSRP